MYFRRSGPLDFKFLIRNYMYATFDTQVLTCSCLHLLMQPMIRVRQITGTCTVGALKEYEIRARAYLDMVKVLAVIISTPDRLFKVIIACCIDQRGRLSISW